MKAIGVSIKNIPEMCCAGASINEGDNIQTGIVRDDKVYWSATEQWNLSIDKETASELVLIQHLLTLSPKTKL